jgi:CRISPR system Cascade subunit CasE
MYLSRVKINTSIRNTLKFLSSPQVVHAVVEASFADSDQTRKLWRIDYYRGHSYMLLFSQNKPDFADFIKQFGYPDMSGEVRDYQKVLDILQNGQQYRFRLCANPVYSIKQGESQRGKIVPHITISQQEGWLQRKSEGAGFTLNEFAIKQRGIKKFTRQHKYVTLSTATYEGVLKIKDAEAFRATLIQGIGRAKSYGCGLLTLAKL